MFYQKNTLLIAPNFASHRGVRRKSAARLFASAEFALLAFFMTYMSQMPSSLM